MNSMLEDKPHRHAGAPFFCSLCFSLTACFDPAVTMDLDTETSSTSPIGPTTGASALCGNGILDPGEECDDASLSYSGACLPTCLHARCGDGHIWVGEELCDDGNADNTDACVACSPARCGDGHVWTGHEECDDGSSVNDDSCTAECQRPPGYGSDESTTGDEIGDTGSTGETAAIADSTGARSESSTGENSSWNEESSTGYYTESTGNGESTATGEEPAPCVCQLSDDVCLPEGESPADDPCQVCNGDTARLTTRDNGSTCGLRSMCLAGECTEVRRVFTTQSSVPLSQMRTANGLCAASGLAHIDPSTRWFAWTYPHVDAPAERFEHFDGPYVNILGTVIADDWDMLISTNSAGSRSLRAPLNISEFGNVVEGLAATGVAADGTGTSNHCAGWQNVTSDSNTPFRATIGYTSNTNSTWSDGGLLPCLLGLSAHIYCFEQAP